MLSFTSEISDHVTPLYIYPTCMSSLVALSSSMDQKKATAAQIENVRRQWEELDYQSKVALSLHFADNLEKLEESMASQSSRESPSRPTQAKETQKRTKTKKVNKAKTSLPSAPPKGHLEELAEAPTTKDQEPPAATQRLAEGMTSTPTKRPRAADSSKEEDGFTTVQKKKKRGSASPPQARRPTTESTPRTTPEQPEEKRTRPTRIPPLVIEGPLVDKMASPTELRKVIKIPERIRVTKTKAGTYLLHCRTEDDRLEALTHGSKHTSFCVRPTKRTTEEHRASALQVVVTRFPTHIKAEDIRRKGNERFQRMKSAKDNREINKIKITTNNEAERDYLLENGFPFEGVRYHCEEYRPQKEPVQCFKCQKFGHTTKDCRETKDTCRKCGSSHRTSDCSQETRRCSNCQGSHPTTYPGCPARKVADAEKRTQALTYAQATRKTDELDTLKLTLAVTEAIASCLSDHTGIECSIEDTAKIVTATFNKIFRQDYNHTAITRFLTKKH